MEKAFGGIVGGGASGMVHGRVEKSFRVIARGGVNGGVGGGGTRGIS